MAHLPPKNLPAFEPLPQRKTLFLPAPGTEGILVETIHGRPRKRQVKFTDSAAAFSWCLKHRSNLVFYFNDDPSKN